MNGVAWSFSGAELEDVEASKHTYIVELLFTVEHTFIVRASPGCRRPLFKRSVACVTEGVSVVPVVARLRKEDGCSSLRRGLGQANCGLC